MSVITTGALTFEKVGSELLMTAGPDALRTRTNAAALHEHAAIIRAALEQFTQNGTARTVEFVLNYNFYSAPYVTYFFKLTAEGSLRNLDVTTPGYVCAIGHHQCSLTSGWVAASVFESFADWLDG